MQKAIDLDATCQRLASESDDLIVLSLFSFEASPLYVDSLQHAGRLSRQELERRADTLGAILRSAVEQIRRVTEKRCWCMMQADFHLLLFAGDCGFYRL